MALQGLSAYLKRLNLTGFDLDGYLSKLSRNTTNVPTIGLTISGGGYSSSLTGIGFVRALDDRFAPSVRACVQSFLRPFISIPLTNPRRKTGGLLQSATYMAGLSGGSWPIMGLATYNFPEIDAMVYDWHMSEPPTPAKPTPHRGDLETMFKQLYEKLEAGFNVSYGDLYGRAGAYTFAVSATRHSSGDDVLTSTRTAQRGLLEERYRMCKILATTRTTECLSLCGKQLS